MTSNDSNLPLGTIVQRTIRGKIRFYHQWRENGKTCSRYLKANEVQPLRELIERRKALAGKPIPRSCATFANSVISGSRLAELTASARRLGARQDVQHILRYLHAPADGTILLLTGLPGSGKTTMLHQAILGLDPALLPNCAYLSLVNDCPAADFLADLTHLSERGTSILLIDGLDRSPCAGRALPAVEDTFAQAGMKIVLASDHPSEPSVSSRTKVLSTTYLSFRDATVLKPSADLVEYLAEGGPDGRSLDAQTVQALEAVNRTTLLQVFEGLVHNHTLRTSRLLNDILKISRRLAEEPAQDPDETTLARLKKAGLVAQAEEEVFLLLPGMRRRLSEETLRRLLDDPVCAHLGAAERKMVHDAILQGVTERTLADLVLVETIRTRANKTTDVFRIRFPVGGFDVVVADSKELTCELREVRLSSERDDRQLTNLVDQRKLDTVEHRYGIIVSRELVYLGRNAWHPSGIAYRNAAAYLGR